MHTNTQAQTEGWHTATKHVCLPSLSNITFDNDFFMFAERQKQTTPNVYNWTEKLRFALSRHVKSRFPFFPLLNNINSLYGIRTNIRKHQRFFSITFNVMLSFFFLLAAAVLAVLGNNDIKNEERQREKSR